MNSALQMNIQLSTLDLDTLQVMYARKEQELSQLLISGALWKETEGHRNLLTGIAQAMHWKVHGLAGSHPAEYGTRAATGPGTDGSQGF
ncbi:MAG TPA: hypothetical protein VHK69_05485 [Chitinophagaceae bacterium]|jgi:hypothetical protein|nr:hypothetical protein [Chitinophagaceae bacterium]